MVFPNSIGKPAKPTFISDGMFPRLYKKGGLPDIRFHDLRRKATTLLLAQGVTPKIVRERLGLPRIAIILDIYSHVTPEMQQLAADTMDEVLGK